MGWSNDSTFYEIELEHAWKDGGGGGSITNA